MNWTGKIAIVTGALGGIGSAICRKLASMSLMWKRYRVTVCYDAGSRRENIYDGWMKNPKSAMISCNDGFRPVSFLLEALDEESL